MVKVDFSGGFGIQKKVDDVKRGMRIAIWSLVAIIALIILIANTIFLVQPGERGMLYSWSGGLKPAVYTEGAHVKMPFFNSAIKMNVMVQKQEEAATAASKDLQDVTTTVAVNFKIDPASIQDVYRTIGQSTQNGDYMQSEIMNPIITESVKQATAKYTAEELISKRAEVKQLIDAHIAERMAVYHIIVTDVSITDFKFSPSFTKAIEDKVTAEQNALKEQRNIEVAKNIAQQKIEAAKGDAQAISIINTELARSPEYTKFLIVNKWNGVMPLALGSGSLVSIADTESVTK